MYMSVFIASASTTFRTLYIQLFCATCFSCFWSSSDRFYKDMRGKKYWRI